MKNKKFYIICTIIGTLLIITAVIRQPSGKKWLNTIESLQEADKIKIKYTSSNTSDIYIDENLYLLKQDIFSITEINKFNNYISQKKTAPYCKISFYQNDKPIGTATIWELSESIKKDDIDLTSLVNGVPCVLEIGNRFCQFNKDNLEIN
ncbi:hypothetical protein SH1V18_19150 [Vallitalea longa]|uniref:Uncharacterized protein n=1 Tax=Vallitalea longa TaxID=2936439 RepID=A0A9W5YB90_9FIRM|nr:hypothetical protein [Vallitalea longa]GKX29435.1 hypothetical protein SH1V18_19150 [Vallitalea longa]